MKKTPLLYQYIGKQNYKKISKIIYNNKYTGRRSSHPIWAMIREIHSNLQPNADITIKGKKLEEAIKIIKNKKDTNLESFLNNHLNKTLFSKDITSINAGIAEIMSCADLILSGFNVKNIKTTSKPTPDFEISYGEEKCYIEVNCKHYEENEKTIWIDTARETNINTAKISTKLFIVNQFSFPSNPNENDIIQGIQKISQIKDKSKQAKNNKIPFILWIDLWNGNYEFSESILGNTNPFKIYNTTISSDIIWHSLYGWKGCPIFDKFPISWLIKLQKWKTLKYKIKKLFSKKSLHSISIDKIISKMQHNGKFIGDNKISAIIFSFKSMKYICENPYAKNQLSNELRFQLLNIPQMDISKSIINLGKKQIKNLIKIYKNIIKSFNLYTDFTNKKNGGN